MGRGKQLLHVCSIFEDLDQRPVIASKRTVDELVGYLNLGQFSFMRNGPSLKVSDKRLHVD